MYIFCLMSSDAEKHIRDNSSIYSLVEVLLYVHRKVGLLGTSIVNVDVHLDFHIAREL